MLFQPPSGPSGVHACALGGDREAGRTVGRALLNTEKLVCVLDVAGFISLPHAQPISKEHRVYKLVILSPNVASQLVKWVHSPTLLCGMVMSQT